MLRGLARVRPPPLGVNSLAMGLKEKDLAKGFNADFFSAAALRGVASAQQTDEDMRFFALNFDEWL